MATAKRPRVTDSGRVDVHPIAPMYRGIPAGWRNPGFTLRPANDICLPLTTTVEDVVD
jgi:hypothetical protein